MAGARCALSLIFLSLLITPGYLSLPLRVTSFPLSISLFCLLSLLLAYRRPPHFPDLKTEAQRGEAVHLTGCKAGSNATPCACSARLRAHIPWDAELLSTCLLYVGFMDASTQPEMYKYTLGCCGWTSWKLSTDGSTIPKEEKQFSWRSVGVQGRSPSYFIL